MAYCADRPWAEGRGRGGESWVFLSVFPLHPFLQCVGGSLLACVYRFFQKKINDYYLAGERVGVCSRFLKLRYLSRIQQEGGCFPKGLLL